MKYQLHDMHYVCHVTTETMSTKKTVVRTSKRR